MLRSLAAALLLALLAGCATPAPPTARPLPPAAVPAPAPAQEAETAEPTVSLVCDPALRKIPFPAMGIPLYTSLLDMALTPDRVWLLVDQHHIVEVGRNPDKPTFRTIVGKDDATWDALDVDPVDGSLWIVSFLRLELIHLIPDGKSTIVRIPRLEGEGGFREVMVDEEAVYVVPTCAEHALWKVARDGKLLGQAFQREGEKVPLTLREEFTPEEGQGSVVGCVPVALARDLSGRITVFDGPSRAFYRQEAGEWKPLLEIPDPELPAGGVRVDKPGTEEAIWSPFSGSSGNAPEFFFLGEEPVFQPEFDNERSKPGRIVLKYLHPAPEGMGTSFERCKTRSWSGKTRIVSDQHGYVSTMDNQLVLGTFSGTN
jgi:hypothetical protein